MNSELIALAEKRGELKATMAMQRDLVAQNIWPVETLLDTADRAVEGVEWLKGHPRVVVAAALVLFIVKPRRTLRVVQPLWRYGRRGFIYWQAFQRLRKKLRGVL